MLTAVKAEPQADSRLLARQMGKKHPSLFELLKDYRSAFEPFELLQLGDADHEL
jgi:hypothetical protein